MIDSCTFLYKRLERQNVLKGFGCVDGEYPEKSVDITPAKLEQITGKPSRVLFCRHCRTYFSGRIFLHDSIYSMISVSSYSYYVKILSRFIFLSAIHYSQYSWLSSHTVSSLSVSSPVSNLPSLSLSSFFVLFLSLHLYLFPSIYLTVHLIMYLTIIIFLRFEHSCSDTNATHNLLATSRHRLLSR